ncbi:hypothetical protein PVAND_017423 [Polypedilum vanderplanki]|uniref:Uncharacterized protein n=1 Tax=Polypedilum vanderplanki TaxID=319348 RepID=A0A9J6BIM5_POLVA|nr:hypothetical protein PVAND_017423 [Polypedilum vanderplanki]
MKKFFTLFLLLLFHHSSAQPSPYSFKNQFIGNYSNYVTAEEELGRNYCNNYWCTNDAYYLFTKSSQYPNVDPCNDFKNFTVDQVVQVDVPDDRFLFRGFLGIIQLKYFERQRKVVAAKFDPIKDENSRVIKIMKNTFSQCLKSKHTLRHIQAHKDIVDHLQSLGGSPYLSKHIHFNRDKFNEATDYGIEDLWTNNVPNSFNEDELWTGETFNISRYFEDEPYHALLLFFDLEIKRCENDVLCLKKPEESWGYVEKEEIDFGIYNELLRTLDDAFRMRPQLKKILIDQLYWPAIKRKRNFFKNRNMILEKFRKEEKTKIKIKNLQVLFPKNFKIDWLTIINSEFFEESKMTENDEILIESGIDLLQKLAKNFMETDKKTISETFDITFLYRYRTQIILRFHNDQDFLTRGYKQGQQRWISCLYQFSLDIRMQPALLVMYEQYRSIWDRSLGDFDRDLMDERIDIVGNAKKLIQEAVDEFKKRFLTESAPLMPFKIAVDVLFKMKNLKILIGLPNSIFPISKLEEFYKNLNLTGNENFMESYWEIEKHHRRLRNEPKTSWRRQIDQVVDTGDFWAKYSVEDGNILCKTRLLINLYFNSNFEIIFVDFSPLSIIYPHYHPLRPRFFNMATLFEDTLSQLFLNIKEYTLNKYQLDVEPTTELQVQISYEHYKNWLKNHKEMQIGANYLTNEQLFWVADAVEGFNKYHRTVPKSINERNRLNYEYMHVRYKFMKGFQDAFQCNITDDENNKLLELLHKHYML